MLKYFVLFIASIFVSYSSDGYPRSCDFKEVELGEFGIYIIVSNNNLTKVDLFSGVKR
jgi:hypothetical protein